MQDILLLYASDDSEKWKDYILDVLCKNDLNLTVVCKDLQKDEEEILRIINDFLVVSILVSPAMLDTMALAARLAPVLDVHACVTVILLYTDITDLDTELGQNFRSLKSWKSFDITNKPDIENKRAISEIVDLLEKERELKRRLQSTQPDPRPRSSGKSGGARSVRTILKAVCPERVVKKGESILLVLKKPPTGIVQVEFKHTAKKIDTEKLNPYCYRFLAPDLAFGTHHFNVLIDGQIRAQRPLPYVAPTQMAYECPAFLCQALDVSPGDMDALDKKLTSVFRTSLPGDEALARILSPSVLASEVTASKVDLYFPTLLHFAAFHGLQDLCNALLDMPGAVAAFHKRNIKDEDPLDIAEEQGHEELAEFMSAFLEMQETITTYEEFYVHMTQQYKNVENVRKPNYMEMGLGLAGDQDDEDEYVKTTARAIGVSEVLPDEDIKEDPSPGIKNTLPPRKNSPASPNKPPKPTSTRSYQQDNSPAPRHDISQAPPVTPRRVPPLEPAHLKQESPEEFFGMSAEVSLHPRAQGSRTMQELVEIQDAFKKNYINEHDVQLLYASWNQRLKDGNYSASMKERQKQLQDMKEKFNPLIKTAEKKEKRGFFDRLTRKKKKPPELQIEHIPNPNTYISWSDMPLQHAPPVPVSEIDARLSTMSTLSNSSTSSSGSSTSRDSALSLSNIPEQDSDDEVDDVPPEIPTRRVSSEKNKGDKRKSLGAQLLQSVQDRPQSRLPQPPPQYKAHSRAGLPPMPPPKVPAHATKSQPLKSTPAVPPRKTSS